MTQNASTPVEHVPPAEAGSEVPLHMRRAGIDPAPELRDLPAGPPLPHTELTMGLFRRPAWLVTRYDDVRAVLGDATRFSNRMLGPDRPPAGSRPQVPPPAPPPGMLLAYDPPDHTRLRRLLTGQFTVRRMEQLRPRITAIIDEHLDGMQRLGEQHPGEPVDLMQAFALPIPSLVICELLGVPYADRAEFQQRSNDQLDFSLSYEQRAEASAQSHAYMAGLVQAQRQHPGDDLLGMLVREHGDELDDAELIGVAALLLLAGHETTASMLGLGALALLEHPDQLAALRDGRVPVEDAVEELMRYLTIVHSGVGRTALTDLMIGGQEIKAGDEVVCSLPLANRDAPFGSDPDRLDLFREPAPHLGFGHGVHHCLGAPLARMEMRLAFPALLRRFPTLRLAVPADQADYRTAFFVHGLHHLPVAW